MSFYTNVAIDKGNILLRGYENGKKIKKVIPFRPYLYTTSKVPTDTKTIDGQYVGRIDFENVWEARKWTKQWEDVTGFKYAGLDKWPYVFIHDNYPSNIDYDVNLIRVLCFDIETDDEGGYPNIELADKVITAITIRYKDTKIVFSYKDYTSKDPKVKYFKCHDEEDLLHKFINSWITIDPDVVTGWNIAFFDIPYIINRIIRILGEDYAKRLSPWLKLIEREVYMFGRDQKTYTPVGVAVLDYLDLYKKFTYNQRDSYKLDNIAFVELGERKVDYSEYSKLSELYKKDFTKFIDYNIHDVDLVYRLDEKMKLIELVYSMAYDARVNFTDALTTVLYWDILIYNFLADKNIAVPKYSRTLDRPFEGGYVKDVKPGMYDWVVSFDLTSLYPHLIIQYNIGPDTFATKMPHFDPNRLLNKDFSTLDKNITMAANGCCYWKTKQSFFSELMELQFKQRVEAKNKMLDYKKRKQNGEKVDNEIAKYNNIQMAKKIQLNSAYGAIANFAFRYFNVDNAEAITLSGQLAVQWVAKDINDFINHTLGTKDIDYVIAMDTDSVYLNLGDLVNRQKVENKVDFLDKFCEENIQPVINKSYESLAQNLNVYKNAMKMKREAIGDRAIWVAKKRYMMNVLDNEGVRLKEPELKTTGIEAVRSSTPLICREAIKEAITIIMSKDIEDVRSYINDFRKIYYSGKFIDIAFPRGVNGLTKYEDKVKTYKLGTPIHVRASLMYNKLIKDRGLKNDPIFDGDKIKFTLLKVPNPTHENVIGSTTTIPEDIERFIDYPLMFEKSFIEPLKNILDSIGWDLEQKANLGDLF